ncbi:MAG: hypothetical protein K0S33_3990 [Bacteroidetes bacterium]|jgi:hypothetical protein|nr:hypothetical protein [Bacteroidota bacterium]
MYKILIIASFCFFCSRISAQQEDSIRTYKNEIGLNLVPAISLLSGSFGNNTNHSLQFKRQLTEKIWYRAGLGYLTNRNPVESVSPTYTLAGETDSTYAVTYSNSYVQNEFRIMQGIEFRFGKKRIKQFTGMDMGYGRSSSSQSEIFALYNKPTYSYGIPNSEYFTYKERIMDSVISAHSTRQNILILNPFYGAQFHITKHLYFSAQLGLNFKLSFNKTSYIADNANKYPDTSHSTGFDFQTTGILNDFSIFYRF